MEVLKGIAGRGAGWVAAVVLAGCGPPPAPEGLFPGVTTGGDREVVQADPGPGDAGAGGLVADGTWVLWTETATCVATMGIVVEGLSESLGVVMLRDLGRGLVSHALRNCLIRQTPVLGILTEIPDAMAEAIPEREYLGVLEGGGVGAAYLSQESVEMWGLALADPWGDPLPDSADDPRVWDMDGDGKPGVTLPVGPGLCEVWVVQRSFSRWSGRVESPGRIAGGGQARGEERVLGATSGFCLAENHVRYLDARHRFVLMRADGRHGSPDLDRDGNGRVTCDEVRSYGLDPFGPRQPDDAHCREDPGGP